jgi:hypothetical protein
MGSTAGLESPPLSAVYRSESVPHAAQRAGGGQAAVAYELESEHAFKIHVVPFVVRTAIQRGRWSLSCSGFCAWSRW